MTSALKALAVTMMHGQNTGKKSTLPWANSRALQSVLKNHRFEPVQNLPGQIKAKDEYKYFLTMCDWKQGKEIHSYYSYLTLYWG